MLIGTIELLLDGGVKGVHSESVDWTMEEAWDGGEEETVEREEEKEFNRTISWSELPSTLAPLDPPFLGDPPFTPWWTLVGVHTIVFPGPWPGISPMIQSSWGTVAVDGDLILLLLLPPLPCWFIDDFKDAASAALAAFTTLVPGCWFCDQELLLELLSLKSRQMPQGSVPDDSMDSAIDEAEDWEEERFPAPFSPLALNPFADGGENDFPFMRSNGMIEEGTLDTRTGLCAFSGDEDPIWILVTGPPFPSVGSFRTALRRFNFKSWNKLILYS